MDKHGKRRDAALQDRHGDGGKHGALAEGCRHRHHDDKVENGFGDENGGVAVQAVVDRADDRHGADAHREGGADKAVDEAMVLRAMGLPLQEFAEALKAALDIDDLPKKSAENKTADNENITATRAADEKTIAAISFTLPVPSFIKISFTKQIHK